MMKTAPKMHRPTAISAAILMILMESLNLSLSLPTLTEDTPFTYAIQILGSALITVLIAVMLFRGRKDPVAGIVFLFAVAGTLLYMGSQLLSILAGFEKYLYALLTALSCFVLAIFWGLSAAECLTQGKISADSGREYLWMLPILWFLCEAAAHGALCWYNAMVLGEIVFSTVVYSIPNCLGTIILGFSLSKPKKQPDTNGC